MLSDDELHRKAKDLRARAEREIAGDARREALVEGALRFLRAGGSVSWTEWHALDAESRGALRAAGKVAGVERAAELADALGPVLYEIARADTLRPADAPAPPPPEPLAAACRRALAEAAGRTT